MCGIVGTYNFKRSNLHENYIAACLKTMKHRGPDDNYIWNNGENYIAGFVRLSIRDLSIHGRQPMLSACGNYCISFNGEIYNTDALRVLLKPHHIQYCSTTDTEVLFYSIIHLGINKTLEVADGMFAFAFYDLHLNQLILARDRMGIKPLYIGMYNEGIVYSSQYDHIINHPSIRNNGFCEPAVGAYLQMGYMPENSGVVQHTKLLLHGYYYIVKDKNISSHCYYNYGNNSNAEKLDTENILRQSVQRQLVADVPVGSFMSGGIDSTLVTWYANQKQPMQSFTIGVTDSAMDESEAAEKFADIFKTKHNCRFIDRQTFAGLTEDHFKAFSEPFADYSSIPTLMLSAFAREKVTVALSGDGGDELFWGYPRNRKVPMLAPFYESSLWTRRLKLLLAKVKEPATIEIMRHWNMHNFLEYYYNAIAISGAAYWLPQVFNSNPAHSFFLDKLEEAWEHTETHNTSTLMDVVRKMEMDIHLQRILLKVDRASMYHSLEVRVPFLSNAMLDHSESFNYTECIKHNQGKMNLRKLLAHKAGDQLVYKPKKGFTIPMDEWLRNEIKNEVTEKIMNMPAAIAPMFNRNALHAMLQQHISGKRSDGWFIWAVYSLVRWFETHWQKQVLIV